MHRPALALAFSLTLVALSAAVPVGATNQPNLVKDINPTGASNPTDLTAVGSTLYFAANDGVHGNELWKSDGTAAGTKMVKNIRPLAKSSDPQNLINVNGKLFFTANDGTHGRELWKSNGTAAGTKMVKDLIPQCGGGYGCIGGLLISRPLVAIGSQVYFINDYCCVGGNTVYVSDGTASGTKRLASLPVSDIDGGVTSYNGKFYFAAYTDYDHAAVWVSNGTRAGTYDLGAASGDDIVFLPVSGQSLYFATYLHPDNERDIQLWKTDGTVAGTKPLTSESALADPPMEAAYMTNRLYFSDGPDGSLWKTDGTVSGTKTVSAGRAQWLTVAGGKLYFSRNENLWTSDGTTAGTTDMGPVGIYGPSGLVAVGTQLCFVAIGNGEWALWESDGTAPGTYQVMSFVGALSEVQQAALGSKLYFGADDGVKGTELWSYTP